MMFIPDFKNNPFLNEKLSNYDVSIKTMHYFSMEKYGKRRFSVSLYVVCDEVIAVCQNHNNSFIRDPDIVKDLLEQSGIVSAYREVYGKTLNVYNICGIEDALGIPANKLALPNSTIIMNIRGDFILDHLADYNPYLGWHYNPSEKKFTGYFCCTRHKTSGEMHRFVAKNSTLKNTDRELPEGSIYIANFSKQKEIINKISPDCPADKIFYFNEKEFVAGCANIEKLASQCSIPISTEYMSSFLDNMELRKPEHLEHSFMNFENNSRKVYMNDIQTLLDWKENIEILADRGDEKHYFETLTDIQWRNDSRLIEKDTECYGCAEPKTSDYFSYNLSDYPDNYDNRNDTLNPFIGKYFNSKILKKINGYIPEITLADDEYSVNLIYAADMHLKSNPLHYSLGLTQEEAIYKIPGFWRIYRYKNWNAEHFEVTESGGKKVCKIKFLQKIDEEKIAHIHLWFSLMRSTFVPRCAAAFQKSIRDDFCGGTDIFSMFPNNLKLPKYDFRAIRETVYPENRISADDTKTTEADKKAISYEIQYVFDKKLSVFVRRCLSASYSKDDVMSMDYNHVCQILLNLCRIITNPEVRIEKEIERYHVRGKADARRRVKSKENWTYPKFLIDYNTDNIPNVVGESVKLKKYAMSEYMRFVDNLPYMICREVDSFIAEKKITVENISEMVSDEKIAAFVSDSDNEEELTVFLPKDKAKRKKIAYLSVPG